MQGAPAGEIPKFIKKHKISALVTDFDPLRIKQQWKKAIAGGIEIPFYEVDAHNIVPCCWASGKQEYGAYTIRPKIHRLLPEFLTEFDRLKKHPLKYKSSAGTVSVSGILKGLKINRAVGEVDWIKPGEKAARKVLNDFIKRKLKDYDAKRNDPNEDGQSNLSPYLHFGQISAQRVALEVKKSNVGSKAKRAFLEELIVRRELSDNFCFYNKNYDSANGFPGWAKETLRKHGKDKREYVYSIEKLEKAQTHDDLWNAAQMQMVKQGKMHGYMRMYWAKKILEWSRSARQAMKAAIYLNDKYELDGRDPNGYVGVAWSIGSVHDRAWSERNVFGKIRYMSYNGCKSKFDVEKYIAAHLWTPNMNKRNSIYVPEMA